MGERATGRLRLLQRMPGRPRQSGEDTDIKKKGREKHSEKLVRMWWAGEGSEKTAQILECDWKRVYTTLSTCRSLLNRGLNSSFTKVIKTCTRS